MGVTIFEDVWLKKTGLSITTVSLVLNKKDNRISERTRQLINPPLRSSTIRPTPRRSAWLRKKPGSSD